MFHKGSPEMPCVGQKNEIVDVVCPGCREAMPGVRVERCYGRKRARVNKVRRVTQRNDFGDGPFYGLSCMAFLQFDLQHRSEGCDGATRTAQYLRFGPLHVNLDETHVPNGNGIERARGYAHRAVRDSGLSGVQRPCCTGNPAAVSRHVQVCLAIAVGKGNRMGSYVAGSARSSQR